MKLGLRHHKDGTGDCAVIFIHGILSDGETGWRHKNGTYWPDLLAESDLSDRLSVFVYTYQSNVFSGDYNLDDVVLDLRQRMRSAVVKRHRSVVFVGHSMGGIIARRYLVRRQLDSQQDSASVFGLLLVASPSLGSEWGRWLTPIAQAFDHSQADALRFTTNNRWLDALDRDFRDLKESKSIDLLGRELIEDKFIVLRRLGIRRLVDRLSGARYFGEALTIAQSDHFSICKPESNEALQHVVLLELLSTVLSATPTRATVESSSRASAQLPPGVYLDPESNLMWTTTDNGSDLGWNEAKEYARQLSLGGYGDWRLPTIDELEDLFDALRDGPLKIRNPLQVTGPLIWSSTKQSPGSGWFFSFESGVRLYNIYGAGTNRCLCVRTAT